MRFLVYKGYSKYDALRVFADELIKEFRKKGIEVDIVGEDIEHYGDEFLKALEKRYDAILSMNGVLAEQTDETGKNLNNYFDAPFFSYLVDHPYMHHNRLLSKVENHHVMCVENTFCAYVKEYYTNIQEVLLFPQAGIEAKGSKRIEERTKDVVFLGTCRGYEKVLDGILKNNIKKREVFLGIIDELQAHRQYTLEQAFQQMLSKYGVELPKDKFAEDMAQIKVVDDYIRSFIRETVVKAIVDAGITIHVYGDGWEKLYQHKPENLHLHPPVPYYENVRILQDAKIVLHVSPWAKAGFHDRIACAMLNGAVCVADETTYLTENKLDEKGMSFYSLTQIEALPSIIKNLLANEDKMQQMASDGYKYAKANHTWEARANQFISHIKMLKKEKEKNGVLYFVVKGGTVSHEMEAMFRLCKEVNENGYIAKLYIYDQNEKKAIPIPPEYEKNKLLYVTELENEKQNGLLFCGPLTDTLIPIVEEFQGSCYQWWLSYPLKSDSIFLNSTKGEEDITNITKNNITRHLCQNQQIANKVCQEFLLDSNKINLLLDWMGESYATNAVCSRQNIILYRKQDEEKIKEIQEHAPNVEFSVIEQENGFEMEKQLQEAKIYIEVKKDYEQSYIERKAILSGCCFFVVASKEYVPKIPKECVFIEEDRWKEAVLEGIQEVFQNFSSFARKYGKERMMIRKEEMKRKQEITTLLQDFEKDKRIP